ncbi:MAG: outer membrane beta-barrel protein [Deltaproteobacteria bacterium]|nr:outer membrane beta-barrel protein [Deltaproteobacteria bacterium]
MFRAGNYFVVFSMVVAWTLLGGLRPAEAEMVQLMPKTNHSALTMSTDDSFGFLVKPRSPLEVDMVGPGNLTLTVRLNSKKKASAYRSKLIVRRGRKLVWNEKLKLFRSRVGNYKEEASLFPSMPKVIKLKVPEGLHKYKILIVGSRRVKMTVRFEYESSADQTLAQGGDDLALVPLVPLSSPDVKPVDPLGDDIALVPLTPPKPDKPVVAPKPDKPVVAPKPDKPVVAPKPDIQPDKPVVAVVKKPIEDDGSKVITTTVEQPPVVESSSAWSGPYVSVGLKFGQISPMQNIGSTTYTGALDLRYILPVLDGHLSVGAEVGFHQYKFTMSTRSLETKLTVLPIALQLYYNIPVGFLELFLGVGGDMYYTMAETVNTNDPDSPLDGSSLVFGGHVAGGLEVPMGPGNLLLEVRGGFSQGDLDAISKVNVSGLSTTVGYRFIF